ncbi:MAG: hypothetical protein V7606_3754, partial [Burkholderiales bacterium]
YEWGARSLFRRNQARAEGGKHHDQPALIPLHENCLEDAERIHTGRPGAN